VLFSCLKKFGPVLARFFVDAPKGPTSGGQIETCASMPRIPSDEQRHGGHFDVDSRAHLI